MGPACHCYCNDCVCRPGATPHATATVMIVSVDPVRPHGPRMPLLSTVMIVSVDPVRPHGPRMPLLLRCGHTFCEGCLTKLAKTHKLSITCPTCQVGLFSGRGTCVLIQVVMTSIHVLHYFVCILVCVQ